VLILKRSRTIQPTGIPRVNWSSPLTKGIKVLVSGGSGTVNLVRGDRLVSSSLIPGTGAAGSSFKAEIAGYGSILVPNRSEFNAASGWTIFGLIRSTNSVVAQFVLNRNYDGATVPASLCIGGGAGAIDGAAYYSGGWNYSGLGTDIRGDNIIHSVVGILNREGSGALEYYIDGVLAASAAGTTSPPTGTGDLYVGRYENNAQSLVGDIFIAGYSTVAWRTDEVKSFHKNPWQLFGPVSKRIPLNAAAPTLPTLSAATYMPGSITSSGFRPRVTAS
jgi:hypothetical protein